MEQRGFGQERRLSCLGSRRSDVVAACWSSADRAGEPGTVPFSQAQSGRQYKGACSADGVHNERGEVCPLSKVQGVRRGARCGSRAHAASQADATERTTAQSSRERIGLNRPENVFHRCGQAENRQTRPIALFLQQTAVAKRSVTR